MEGTKSIVARSAGAWLILVILAVLNGALREALLVPSLGPRIAVPLSGLLLSALIFLAALAVFPFLGIASSSRAWQAGMLWLVLTVAFEFLFGRFVLGDPWAKLFEAYKIWNGDPWVMVLAAALCSPFLAGRTRRSI